MNRPVRKQGGADKSPALRRRRFGPAAMLATMTLLAGCGWQPLYQRPSSTPNASGVSAKLAQISIDPVKTNAAPSPVVGAGGTTQDLYSGRAAQLLQNYLKDALNPYGRPDQAAYHLAVQLDQRSRSVASVGNGDATRSELFMTAKYELKDARGKVVFSNFATTVASYDVMQEPFSDLESKQDVMQRTVQDLAQEIQTRLGVFLLE
jgi:LPS-assembly lipoprotein